MFKSTKSATANAMVNAKASVLHLWLPLYWLLTRSAYSWAFSLYPLFPLFSLFAYALLPKIGMLCGEDRV